jgi:hypothetical protein
LRRARARYTHLPAKTPTSGREAPRRARARPRAAGRRLLAAFAEGSRGAGPRRAKARQSRAASQCGVRAARALTGPRKVDFTSCARRGPGFSLLMLILSHGRRLTLVLALPSPTRQRRGVSARRSD